MTVKELIKELQKFNPDLEVGGSGHFGEVMELYSVSLYDRQDSYDPSKKKQFVAIYIQDAGPEPD